MVNNNLPQYDPNQPQPNITGNTQNAPDQIGVGSGPGGTSVYVFHDTIFTGPSQSGVFGSPGSQSQTATGGLDSSNPELTPGASYFQMSGNPSWLNYFQNFLSGYQQGSNSNMETELYGYFSPGTTGDTPPTDTTPSPVIPNSSNLMAGVESTPTVISRSIATSGSATAPLLLSTDPDAVYRGLLAESGIDSDPALLNDPKTKTALESALKQMAQAMASKNASGSSIDGMDTFDASKITESLSSLIPSGLTDTQKAQLVSYLDNVSTAYCAQASLSDLQSTDPTTVYNALLYNTGVEFDYQNLSDAQKTEFANALTAMAEKMASQNATGVPVALTSFNSSTVLAYLQSLVDPSMLGNDVDSFNSYLNACAVAIGSLNAASGNSPPQDPQMAGMTSTDPAAVKTTITSLLKAQGLTDEQIAQLGTQLDALASKIATANATSAGSGLDICDPTQLATALTQLSGWEDDPTITATSVPSSALMSAAINALAKGYAAINKDYYTQLSQSTDPAVVLNALTHLSGVMTDPSLTPEERALDLNYLAVMAQALAFMSKVRAKIAILEANFQRTVGQAKLGTIKDESNLSQATYSTQIDKIKDQVSSAISKLKQAAMWKWLGPILTIIMAIISAIIIIGTLGAGTAVGVALLACVIAMTILTVVQQTTNGITKLAEAMGIHDPVAQNAFSFGLQAIMMAIMLVATLGAAAPMIASEAALTFGAQIAEVAGSLATTTGLVIGISMAVSLAMSTGILTDGLVALFKKMGMSEQDAAIAAMVTAIAIMLVLMLASFKLGMKAPSSTEAAGGGSGGASSATGEAAGEGAGVAAGATSAAAGTQVSSTSNNVMLSMLQRLLARMQDLFTDPNVYMKMLQIVSGGLQVGQGVQQALFNVEQSNLTNAMADLNDAITVLTAVLGELQQIAPQFDQTIQALQQDSDDFMKAFTDLLNLFAQMVASAGTIMTNLSQTS